MKRARKKDSDGKEVTFVSESDIRLFKSCQFPLVRRDRKYAYSPSSMGIVNDHFLLSKFLRRIYSF